MVAREGRMREGEGKDGGRREGGRRRDPVSLWCPVHCCACGAGVTDARGCSAPLGAVSAQ